MFPLVMLCVSAMTAIDVTTFSMLKRVALSADRWTPLLPLAMLLYSAQPVLFFVGMRYGGVGMGVLNTMWNITSSITVSIIAYLIIHEHLSFTSKLATVLASLAILLYSMNGLSDT